MPTSNSPILQCGVRNSDNETTLALTKAKGGHGSFETVGCETPRVPEDEGVSSSIIVARFPHCFTMSSLHFAVSASASNLTADKDGPVQVHNRYIPPEDSPSIADLISMLQLAQSRDRVKIRQPASSNRVPNFLGHVDRELSKKRAPQEIVGPTTEKRRRGWFGLRRRRATKKLDSRDGEVLTVRLIEKGD